MREITKISVIIPIYNSEKYLDQCLKSVVNQTYRKLEIILINDGSTDQSGDVCDAFKKKDRRIKVVHKVNGGLSSARNTGIVESTGDYLLFVDSDDWIHRNTCFLAVEEVKKHKADLILWSYIREYEHVSLPKKVIQTKKELLIFEGKEVHNYLQRRVVGLVETELKGPENMDSIVTAWGKLYKAEIIKENMITFEDTKKIGTEDMLFNLHVLEFINKAIYINDYLYHYRRDNESSVTSTSDYALLDRWKNLFSAVENYLVKRNKEQVYFEAFNNRVCLSFIGLGMIVVKDNRSTFTNKLSLLKKILNEEIYKERLKQLPLKHFDFKWTFFFMAAKYKITLPLYFMLYVMVHKGSR